MQPRPKQPGTNLDFRQHQTKRRDAAPQVSDQALLRSAKRAAEAWQSRLMREREARR